MTTDRVEELRLAAGRSWELPEVQMLIRSLSLEELVGLERLVMGWRGWPEEPPVWRVRACLRQEHDR